MMNALMDENRESIVPFELNRELDQTDLSSRFRERYRLRIPDLLEPAGALMLQQHLSRDVKWSTFLVADNTMYSASPGPYSVHTADVEREMLLRAHMGAQSGFACLYDADRLFPEDAPEGTQIENAPRTPLLARFSEFLNSALFLDLCRRVTGVPQIARADIQATRYRPGHFMMFHTMLPYSQKTGKRLAAFEVNLTIEWRPEWGGLYEFHRREHVAEACVPSFNLLDIFSFHRGRWISTVAPFAEGERLAISGWLYGS
jgi:hypothetical protein